MNGNEKMYAKATGPGCRSKVFWKILKQTSGNKKSQSIPTLIDATNIYTSDLSKATLLNAYFVDQSTLDLTNEPPLPDFLLEVETLKRVTSNVRQTTGLYPYYQIFRKYWKGSLTQTYMIIVSKTNYYPPKILVSKRGTEQLTKCFV